MTNNALFEEISARLEQEHNLPDVYALLGVAPEAPLGQINAAFKKLPKEKKPLANELIRMLESNRAEYDQWLAHSQSAKEQAATALHVIANNAKNNPLPPATAQNMDAFEAVSHMVSKLALRNSVVLMGATTLAGAGVLAGASATHRIKAKREEGATVTVGDRLQQFGGYATAAGAVAAAVLMWNANDKVR